MPHKRRLVAGVTASGALLCLTLSADGHNVDQQMTSGVGQTLPLRVEDLRAKLNAGFPAFENNARGNEIENIVQFFNFSNCIRPGWKNC